MDKPGIWERGILQGRVHPSTRNVSSIKEPGQFYHITSSFLTYFHKYYLQFLAPAGGRRDLTFWDTPALLNPS